MAAPTAGTSVTTLKLFFDPVLVAARSADLVRRTDVRGYVTAALVLLVTWWTYPGCAWLANRPPHHTVGPALPSASGWAASRSWRPAAATRTERVGGRSHWPASW